MNRGESGLPRLLGLSVTAWALNLRSEPAVAPGRTRRRGKTSCVPFSFLAAKVKLPTSGVSGDDVHTFSYITAPKEAGSHYRKVTSFYVDAIQPDGSILELEDWEKVGFRPKTVSYAFDWHARYIYTRLGKDNKMGPAAFDYYVNNLRADSNARTWELQTDFDKTGKTTISINRRAMVPQP